VLTKWGPFLTCNRHFYIFLRRANSPWLFFGADHPKKRFFRFLNGKEG
jgi:hypothetical protein